MEDKQQELVSQASRDIRAGLLTWRGFLWRMAVLAGGDGFESQRRSKSGLRSRRHAHPGPHGYPDAHTPSAYFYTGAWDDGKTG